MEHRSPIETKLDLGRIAPDLSKSGPFEKPRRETISGWRKSEMKRRYTNAKSIQSHMGNTGATMVEGKEEASRRGDGDETRRSETPQYFATLL